MTGISLQTAAELFAALQIRACFGQNLKRIGYSRRERFLHENFFDSVALFIGNEKIRNGFVKFLKHYKSSGITFEIRKHIRPAMSELNKRGGAVVLDCLTEEEIAAIMIEHVEKIFNGL